MPPPITPPPIGVMPEWLWKEHYPVPTYRDLMNRVVDLEGAILRYSQAGRPINPQWVRELSLAAYLAGQEKFRPVPQPSAN